MYGKGKLLGVSNVATGLALLPNTDNNRPLLIAAGALLFIGAAVLVLSILLARKRSGATETK